MCEFTISMKEFDDKKKTIFDLFLGETITRNNNVEQAMDCRDAMAKVKFYKWLTYLLKMQI